PKSQLRRSRHEAGRDLVSGPSRRPGEPRPPRHLDGQHRCRGEAPRRAWSQGGRAQDLGCCRDGATHAILVEEIPKPHPNPALSIQGTVWPPRLPMEVASSRLHGRFYLRAAYAMARFSRIDLNSREPTTPEVHNEIRRSGGQIFRGTDEAGF